MENLRLVQSLRERLRNDKSIDAHTLHIPEFADLIDTHITFIEDGIKSQRYGDESDRLELLERLKSEGQQQKTSRTVTYRWWFNFNLRLSFFATPYSIEFITNDELEDIYKNPVYFSPYKVEMIEKIRFLLDKFPERIMIPTIHNLGIMSINKVYGTGIHLIGLRNRPTINMDRIKDASPGLFFWHDIFHILKEDVNDSPEFLSRFQQKLVGLPRYQRKLVESIYLQLTYELRLSLKEGEETFIIKGRRFPIIRPPSNFLLRLVLLVKDAYGLEQFWRLISEVSQELALSDNK